MKILFLLALLASPPHPKAAAPAPVKVTAVATVDAGAQPAAPVAPVVTPTTPSKVSSVVPWINAHWVVLSPMLLWLFANLAVALKKYPQTQSLLWALLDLIAQTSHKDSPEKGLAFGRSIPPEGRRRNRIVRTATPPVAIFLLIMTMASMSGCAWFQKAAVAAGTCAQDSISKQIPDLMPLVTDLALNAQDLEADMAILGAKFSKDLAFCLLQRFYEESGMKLAKAKATPGFKSTPDLMKLEAAHLRAGDWLQRHGAR